MVSIEKIEVSEDGKTSSLGKCMRAPLSFLAMIGFLIAGLGWVVASPLGGSPDEDYHMGSIWCPSPVSESCETKIVDGTEAILVPEAVAHSAKCHAFRSDRSASCSEVSDNVNAYSGRYDGENGNYPKGYFRFHHMFVGSDVGSSVLVMRTVNLAIALVLLTALFVVMPVRFRQGYVLAMIIGWVPMGFYFISSLNPSSWSVTGTFVYGAGLFASLYAEKWRRWAALVVASCGALLCIHSRGDSAFYIFVVSVALLCAVTWKRWGHLHKIFAVAWSIVGVYFMASGGQAGTVASVEEGAKDGFFSVLVDALNEFPAYVAGFWGRGQGPGWLDTPLDGPITIFALLILGGTLLSAARGGSWRRWISAAVLGGAMFGVPFLTTLKGLQPHLSGYQPRYMFPLLAVFFLLLLLVDTCKENVFTTAQKWVIVLFEIIIFALSLRRVLWRYVSGMKGPEPWNLDENIKWWWDVSITPMMVWIGATIAFAVGLIALVLLARQPRKESLACSGENPGAHDKLSGESRKEKSAGKHEAKATVKDVTRDSSGFEPLAVQKEEESQASAAIPQ